MEAKCRLCKKSLRGLPVLSYSDMPGRAQFFPNERQLDEDKSVELNIFQCDGCGLLQLTGEPVYYYRDVIRAAAVSDEMLHFRVNYFKEFLTKYDLENKKIVEIGAGNGEFMHFMEMAGGNVYGVEHNERAVKKCLEDGLRVEKWFPEDDSKKIANGPFHAFYIMNFLEHIPEPDVFLKCISDNLLEDAIGLIEVPNTDMIMKHMMFSEFMLDHLMYFSEDTLKRMLEINGFDVLECKSVWHDYCLCAIVRKRFSFGFEGFITKQEKVTKEVNGFVDEYIRRGEKVAVWGAGHQALAVMAMTGIKDKVSFVVDSADFKQNRFTPGTHIRVCEPDELIRSNVGAVLIMAASYSDEVYSIIRLRYKGIKCAILRENGLEIKENE